LRPRAAGAPETADDWFRRGYELDSDPATMNETREAYEKALELDLLPRPPQAAARTSSWPNMAPDILSSRLHAGFRFIPSLRAAPVGQILGRIERLVWGRCHCRSSRSCRCSQTIADQPPRLQREVLLPLPIRLIDQPELLAGQGEVKVRVSHLAVDATTSR
jgi:hypothetical protein